MVSACSNNTTPTWQAPGSAHQPHNTTLLLGHTGTHLFGSRTRHTCSSRGCGGRHVASHPAYITAQQGNCNACNILTGCSHPHITPTIAPSARQRYNRCPPLASASFEITHICCMKLNPAIATDKAVQISVPPSSSRKTRYASHTDCKTRRQFLLQSDFMPLHNDSHTGCWQIAES